jgi:hypothetical protein
MTFGRGRTFSLAAEEREVEVNKKVTEQLIEILQQQAATKREGGGPESN